MSLIKPEGRGSVLTFAGNELYRMLGKIFAMEHEIESRRKDIRTGRRGKESRNPLI